jgi:hypothetical protein
MFVYPRGNKPSETRPEVEMWVFTVESGIGNDPTQGIDVTGFGVEALDGSIEKVDEASGSIIRRR